MSTEEFIDQHLVFSLADLRAQGVRNSEITRLKSIADKIGKKYFVIESGDPAVDKIIEYYITLKNRRFD